ncbi:MAG: DMT family transporter [Coriobacteriia bacterium]|nr:DMT family transporter [Coriobacteriia bacterium]MCL2745943.1 DMT family transporter [Coriobacteriia bacterium]MCL2871333.1 DMT family transporter [Coriobacteriia bacterium]
MKRDQQIGKSAIAALITVSLWASAFPAVKYLLDYYSAESIMVLRFLIASLVVTAVILIKKVKLPDKKDIPLFALAGLLGIFLYSWFFITGVNTVPSGVSSFLIASAPVFATLFSIALLKEKVKLLSWIGIIVSFCGLAAVTASQMSGFVMNIGAVLLVGASISTSLYTIIQRKLTEKYTPFEAAAYSVLFGTLFTLVFLPGLIREVSHVPLVVNLIPLYLGIFPAAIAYLSWSYALAKARSTAHVTMFVYLIPFLATLLAFFWLGESITPAAFVGGIIIIAGMLISNLTKKD